MYRKKLNHDWETYSDLNLKSVGVSEYMRHPSTEVLMLAYTFDDDDSNIRQWDVSDKTDMPNEFLDALEDERVQKSAWGASFEQNAAAHILKVPVCFEDWTDPSVLARHLSLPGALGDVGKILGLPEEMWKHSTGKALINFFCGPRKPTKKDLRVRNHWYDAPDKWATFKLYSRQDVVAEISNYRRMKRHDMSDWEWDLWKLDREINERGVPVDLEAIDNAQDIVEKLTAQRVKRLTEITGLKNPNSGPQLLGWLKDGGYQFDDMKVGHIKRAHKELSAFINSKPESASIDDRMQLEALQIRTEISKASIKKYNAYGNMANSDGLLRNMHVFGGAGRTSRWSGSGVQLHNLARPAKAFESAESQIVLAKDIRALKARVFDLVYGKGAFEALSSGVRGVIKAPDGFVFIDADWNAIENRVLGYIADEERILNVFLQNRDPYVDFASYMYGIPYDVLWAEYKAGDKTKRTIAKPGVLGCGYMLSAGKEYEDESTGEMLATGLLGYARNMGVDLTFQQSETSVEVWRGTFSKCVDFWYDVEKAVRTCIERNKRTECGPFEFHIDGPFLKARLPSGRHLHYLHPRIEMWKKPWGKVSPSITYEGLDSKSTSKAWGRISTHPGKITENLDQAFARDILATGIKRARRRGIDIRLHVHDQIIALSKEDEAERNAKILQECMEEPMDWAPSLPLKVEAEISKYFVKT